MHLLCWFFICYPLWNWGVSLVLYQNWCESGVKNSIDSFLIASTSVRTSEDLWWHNSTVVWASSAAMLYDDLALLYGMKENLKPLLFGLESASGNDLDEFSVLYKSKLQAYAAPQKTGLSAPGGQWLRPVFLHIRAPLPAAAFQHLSDDRVLTLAPANSLPVWVTLPGRTAGAGSSSQGVLQGVSLRVPWAALYLGIQETKELGWVWMCCDFFFT